MLQQISAGLQRLPARSLVFERLANAFEHFGPFRFPGATPNEVSGASLSDFEHLLAPLKCLSDSQLGLTEGAR